MQNTVSYDRLVEKWAPVLNEESAGNIKDSHRRAVTAAVLENQEIALKEEAILNETTNAASVANWNPVLIALVRRAMPNLVAYDICGVQPMTGPTGLIFAMKSEFQKTKAGVAVGEEALFNEAPVGYSGDSAVTGNGAAGPSGLAGTLDGDNDSTIIDSEGDHVPYAGDAYTTAEAEVLSVGSNETIATMGFTIEKATVTAKSRALKANYTVELAQDLKAIHGLDAETELANILSTEILAEINREVVRTVNRQAKIGSRQTSNQTLGIFDLSTDADGRWSVEKYKGLIMQIEREANTIAKETRRGKGNFILCSSDVAAALNAAGMLDYTPALSSNLNVDDTGNTFAGTLNGRLKVYIDPYSTRDYINVGYKGTNPYDAGLFYCPYVPLTMVKAVGEEDFQPRIGFKTRYGMVSNPYVGSAPANGLASDRTNQYYRISAINNLLT
jgi:hypothetical protein